MQKVLKVNKIRRNMKMENITIRKEVEIVVTPQAQMILAESKHSVEEFTAWALEDQKISLGGNNVAIFLEKKFKENEVKG
jgi:hypothetical protein